MEIFLLLLLLKTFVRFTTSCSLERGLFKNGFHRDLKTSISFPPTALPGDAQGCRARFLEQIPSGIYVDPFQLQDLLPFGGPLVQLSNTIDVEQPEFTSTAFEALIYVNLSHSEDGSWIGGYSLPIHVRYHAISGEDLVHVTIPSPAVAVNCHNTDLTSSINDNYREVTKDTAPCQPESSHMCKWAGIPCHVEGDAVSLDVPVGQKNHNSFVTIATVTTTLIGCFILIWKATQTTWKEKSS